MPNATGHGHTDVGRRRRNNQDSFLVDDQLGLFVVADGMGGHKGGEVASAQAVSTIRSMVRGGLPAVNGLSKLPPPMDDGLPDDMGRRALRLMESAVQAATYMISGMAACDPDKEGMGTTVSALLIRGSTAIMGQVGDSRIYRVRSGQAQQLTEDHTVIAYQLKQGYITPEQAKFSPYKHVITRAVGSKDYVQVDTVRVDVEPGDRFLLCSDGLHGYLGPDELASIASLQAEQAVQRCIELANQRGGRDNITAVLVTCA